MKRVDSRYQEVTDAEGRRRFHGAFTGGFSAGYYNSVGSKEGWTPQTFSSSRANRSSRVEQRPEDFMDEEDDPLLGKRLETSEQYDTLQTESKRRYQHQEKAYQSVSSAIPVFTLPEDWVLPVNDSIGVKLLKQMGWKENHGIGKCVQRHKLDQEATDKSDISAQGDDEVKAQLQLQDEAVEKVYGPPRTVFDVQKVFPQPKLDRHGAGFDPYTDAPEFLMYKKQQREKEKEGSRDYGGVSFMDALNRSLHGSNRATNSYGLGALEESDDVDVYGTISMSEFDHVIAPLGTKKNIQRIGSSAQASHGHEKTRSSKALCLDGRSVLSDFELALSKEKPPKIVNMRLVVPTRFTAYHRFEEDESRADAATALYRKLNTKTDKHCDEKYATAELRNGDREDNSRHAGGDIDNARTYPHDVTKPAGSVFELLDKGQRAKLFDAVKQAKQGLSPSRVLPPVLAKEPRVPKIRQPLICGNDGNQFRATISASIAKRFVSSKSSIDEAETDLTRNDVPHANVSRRSQCSWIPKSILCKRFHVKCIGPTGSSGKDDGNDKKRDLFDKELVPHLMEYAAGRAAQKQSEANLNETLKHSEVVKAEGDEMNDLPPLPTVKKSSASLLQSIFEPSDESDLSEEYSEDESSDDVSEEEEREELRGVSKQELSSNAEESLYNSVAGDQEESSVSDDNPSISTACAASRHLDEQINRLRKRSRSVGTVDGRDARRQAKEEKREHKKHKKHHKHRDNRNMKKDKSERKSSRKHRSSRHFKRSRSAIRSPSHHRRSSAKRTE